MEPDGESEFSEQTQTIDPGSGSPFRVILYNDDWHSMDEVVNQLQKATGCTVEKAVNITLEVDARGRGVCYHGDRDNCHRVAGVLREIRLQVEVDCD
jgi:ATP-dependent Clp protease adapter protein ClpS